MANSKKKRGTTPRRKFLWAGLALVLAGAALLFVRVETAGSALGSVDTGDLVLFESATAGSIAPAQGQVVRLTSGEMAMVVAVQGDEVTWNGKLRVDGEEVALGGVLREPDRAGRDGASLLFRGASGSMRRASVRIPPAVDIPRTPYTIPRHHVLVACSRGQEITTHQISLSEIRSTGRLVIASRAEGERPLPRLLP